LITQCYIHDLFLGRNTQGGNDDCGARGIDLSSASDIEISYNRLLNCLGPSYDYGQDGGAVEIWRAATRIKIHHNNMASCGGVMEVGGQGESVSDVSLYYNVIFYCGLPGNNWFGIQQGAGNDYAIVPSNFTVNNNTIVFSGGVWGMGTWVTMKNNIFYSSSGGGTQSNNFTGNPQFVNISTRDYHLQAGSPCIDAGANLGYTLDYDGMAVPQGGAPDIGAFEYVPVSTPVVAMPEISPNRMDAVGRLHAPNPVTGLEFKAWMAAASQRGVQLHLYDNTGRKLALPATMNSGMYIYRVVLCGKEYNGQTVIIR
jgi:hypothetical protein